MKTERKRNVKGLCLGTIAALTLLASCYEAIDQETPLNRQAVVLPEFRSEYIQGEYIVELFPTAINFRKGTEYHDIQAGMRKLSSEILFNHKIGADKLLMVYGNAMDGFAVKLSEEEFQALKKDPRIKSIEQDEIIAFNKPDKENSKGGGNQSGGGKGGPKSKDPNPTNPEPTPIDPDPIPTEPEPIVTEPEPDISPIEGPIYSGPSTQETPWGIKRVGGFSNYIGKNKAFVLDTGIELDHPDLNVNRELAVTFVTLDRSTTLNDLNGHGTHVAGIIGAIDNSFGVVGVAAGAQLVPVKVLDDNATGRKSWVIAGIDYVAAVGSPGDVANLSLGGSISSLQDDAVSRASSLGIWFIIAAGNNSDDANNYSPARVNGTFINTVSSIDNNDILAANSNYGNPPIDWAAPGRFIKSTYIKGGYISMSGTSMAAPHVAGLRLLGNIIADGYAKQDKDNIPDPIAKRADR